LKNKSSVKLLLFLGNPEFNPAMIETWKTTLSTSDILKDYYFQTNKTLHVFQGQALEI
jgi:hypothetical protein